MILAEKITYLRKKFNMTQEDLAEKLDVSRQSVSKWESSMSTPDINRIIDLAKLFSVSTDFLLNDDMGLDDLEGEDTFVDDLSRLSMEEANEYLSVSEDYAREIGLGVFLLIISPVPINIFTSPFILERGFSKDLADGIGSALLFVLVGLAVIILVRASSKLEGFETIENPPFKLDYGVEGYVKKEKSERKNFSSKERSKGIGLIFLGIIVLVLSDGIFSTRADYYEGIFLGLAFFLVALGVYLLVRESLIMSSHDKILLGSDSDKIKEEKKKSKRIEDAYWSVALAIYMIWSFISNDWGRTWLVWPIAAVLWGAFSSILDIKKG